MTNQSIISLERSELQHQALLKSEEKRIVEECNDLLHDFMLCEHDDAALWQRFTERVGELKQTLSAIDESNKRVQHCQDMQLNEE